MLNSLHITAFQSHKNTRLDFSLGVNVLIGSSDSGKTAVLRALSWLASNRPAGEAFRSAFGGDTIVEVSTDACTVSRVKTDKKNSYFVIQHGNNPKAVADEFKAFGQGVPAEVEAALNLTPINVQSQLDSPFLLSSDWSPGRVAEYLNEVVGLDVIDRSMSNINAKIRQIGGSLDNEAMRLKQLEEKHAELDYVDVLDTRVKFLENTAAEASKTRAAEQELSSILAAIGNLKSELAALPDYSGAAEKIAEIAKIYQERDTTIDNLNALVNVLNAAKITQTALAEARKTARAARLLNHTMALIDERKSFNKNLLELETLLKNIFEFEKVIEREGDRLKQLQQEWQQMAPNTCPLCEGTGRLK